jgi:hypothetical protein
LLLVIYYLPSENKLLNYPTRCCCICRCLHLKLAAKTTIVIAKEHIPTNVLVIAQGLESITGAV